MSTNKPACKQAYKQAFVDQRPVYENQVISKKGIIRPDKRRRKRKFL